MSETYYKKKFLFKVVKLLKTFWDSTTLKWDSQAVWDGDPSGDVINTWSDEVLSTPSFSSQINDIPSSMTVNLARKYNAFSEGEDVAIDNRVDLWIYDREMPNGKLVYSGFISSYSPNLIQGKEVVQVVLFPFAAKWGHLMLENASGETKLAYNNYDPSNILKNLIDLYRLQEIDVNYTDTSVDLTGTTVSYTYNANLIKEAVDKIIELCPDDWFFRVDANNEIWLKQKNLNADHQVYIGKNIISMEPIKRSENIVNKVYFIGGETGGVQLYKVYNDTASQNTYGVFSKKMVDQRVTVEATASVMANREIQRNKLPETRARLEIADSNGWNLERGYDIESLKVGDTIQIKNLNFGAEGITFWDLDYWDTDYWDSTLQYTLADVMLITRLEYQFDKIIVEASSKFPQVAKRIEDINRNLEVASSVNVPTSPT